MVPSPLKIAFLHNSSKTFESLRGELLVEAMQAGHRVAIFVPQDGSKLEELEKKGAQIFWLPLDRTGLNPIADLRYFLSLRKLLKAEIPDLIFCTTIKPVIYGSLAARSLRMKSRVCSLITGLGHTFFVNSFAGRIKHEIARFLYRVALSSNHLVFFQNADDQSVFREKGLLGTTPSKVVGSGVNLQKFSARPIPKGIPGEMNRRIRFLLVARMIREKGILDFVEAARRIRSKNRDVEFSLVGPLDENPSHISKREIEEWDWVSYQGAVADIRPSIEAATVAVLPSYREGASRFLLEAMAMGRPLVTTTVPGCQETVLEGKNGFLVSPRNVDGLVDALQKFISKPELAETMGNQSRILAEEKFDGQIINKRILDHCLN